MSLCLGIDIGTNGARIIAVDAAGAAVARAVQPMAPPRREGDRAEQDPSVWWGAVLAAFATLGREIDLSRVRRIAVDGTSGTFLLIDDAGRPQGPGIMYNDARGGPAARRIAAVAPGESGAHGATSALARLMTLREASPGARALHVLHQADWIAGRLAASYGVSDENNALKTGYDPVARTWPAWIENLDVPRSLLPAVRPPGALLGLVAPAIAGELGLDPRTEIRVGTTDGIAAFLATGAAAIGDAVTSLGTTLVVKVLAEAPVFDVASGVYSHRLGDRWLAGGASNSGGAALLAHFSAERLAALTPMLRPERPTGLHYYPLPAKGERFPIRDPEKPAEIAERPADDLVFFQALLEGVAEVEALAYRRLAELGAPSPRRVLTVGGGARNEAWTRIRGRALGVPVSMAAETEAAYGTALLALHGGPPP
ncbi:MAG TPA: FGGY-family carbohydrate kinase [Verrucomicrobiae bacterium]|nr:FGGY-family carbohydrate kinase [Verrucomicrobiae bacterium]